MNNRIEAVRSALEYPVLVTNADNIFYLSGFSGEGYLFIDEKRAVLFTDGRYTKQAGLETEGFEIVLFKSKMEKELSRFVSKEDKIFFEEYDLTYLKFKDLSDKFLFLLPVENIINDLRIVKDEKEIDLLKKAAAIAQDALQSVLDLIRVGAVEKDISLEIEYAMKKRGAQALSFDSIVASGERGALPHAVPTDRKIQTGDLITIDCGAKFMGYCSDMTRTFAVGDVSDDFAKMYEIVLKAQTKAQNNIKAGMSGKECDKLARDIISECGFGDHFVHSLGHGVGINVHEKPSLSPLSDSVLDKNTVVTIEPGIYLNDLCGIRIEDTVIIHENGAQSLQSFTKNLLVLK